MDAWVIVTIFEDARNETVVEVQLEREKSFPAT